MIWLSFIPFLLLSGLATCKKFDKETQAVLEQLQGTWKSQSGKVTTGPTFFNPTEEILYEPLLPGLSYSFNITGHWESAAYIIEGNNRNHSCPNAKLIWQHGTIKYNKKSKKLFLIPERDDGRQLISDPCFDDGVSRYLRYTQLEELSFEIEMDEYFEKLKLQLFNFNGVKKQPMWLSSSDVKIMTQPQNVKTDEVIVQEGPLKSELNGGDNGHDIGSTRDAQNEKVKVKKEENKTSKATFCATNSKENSTESESSSFSEAVNSEIGPDSATFQWMLDRESGSTTGSGLIFENGSGSPKENTVIQLIKNDFPNTGDEGNSKVTLLLCSRAGRDSWSKHLIISGSSLKVYMSKGYKENSRRFQDYNVVISTYRQPIFQDKRDSEFMQLA
ncbi:rot1 [[Candida] subhashii]|uniref:Protein ROT1 n=1 Tax=[Candida] subhashii TaxID=561895 RepID=A0A8J5UGW6_9ASCO|nr:rot1 [[Candida] subhashii]KAG7662748.1 rot1 [[Candida] subhashii]